MQRILLPGVAILAVFLTVCWASNDSVVGKWACTSDDGAGGKLDWTLVIRQEGGKLAGSMTGDTGDLQLIEPKLEGNIFTFKLHINDNCTVETKLKVDGNKFDGNFACPEVSGTMKGTKQQ